MKNSKKQVLLLLLAVFPLFLAGCSDLFDKGHTERTYSGPDMVEFKPLVNEIQVPIETDGTHEEVSSEMLVQLISSQGAASSDVTVNFSVDPAGTNAADGHYDLSTTSVTIPSGSVSATFTVTIPADADLEVGDEFTVTLNMGEVNGAEAAEELDQSIVYIQGVEVAEEE